MTSLGRKEDLFDLKKDKGGVVTYQPLVLHRDEPPPSFVAVLTGCEALDRRGFANQF